MKDYKPGSMDRDALIAALTEDAAPVKRIKPLHGALLIGLATLVSAIASIAAFDFWTGIVTGKASAFFWITNGLLLLVGAASTTALAAGALPRVGSQSSAPLWSVAMLSVLPAAAMISLISLEANHDHASGEFSPMANPMIWYWECAAYGALAGLIVAMAAVLFLRRGAPVSLERSGWFTGIAAGALGSLAYGVTCPVDGTFHLGFWHVVPVAIWAVIGRISVPPLIRW